MSRAWFSEVSNRLQGQEVFRWWSERLGNSELFREVDQMNDEIYSALAELDTRRMTKVNLWVVVAALVVSAAALVISLVTAAQCTA